MWRNRTRIIRLFITLVFGLSLTFAVLWVMEVQSSTAQAAPVVGSAEIPSATTAELHVCLSGCDYSSVQAAVDAANEVDVIKVATGIYTGVNTYAGLAQVVYLSKTVTIQGGFTTTNWTTPNPEANLTTLDAQGQGRVMYITGDIQPTIEGLRITGGDAQGLGGILSEEGWDIGSGVYVITATAEIRNNQVFSNTCSSLLCNGGGIAISYSDAIISGNTFHLNTTGWSGGGLWTGYSSPTISANLFTSNHAFSGGGVELHMSAGTFSENLVISNTAELGGGMSSHIGTEKIVNNVFADNHGSVGGGLVVSGSSPRLRHNTIAHNRGGDGSGIAVIQSFFGNYSTVDLTNTILVDHGVGISVTGGNTATVNAVLWYATPITVSESITAAVSVHNEYSGDPAFGPDGYHLTAGSAAIDKGIDAGIIADIDGEPRPAGAGYDLGADELWYQIYLPLVLQVASPSQPMLPAER